jgi:hypothetical protein
MRSLKVIALLIPLLLLAGCAKKPAKNTAPSRDDSASAKAQPQQPVAGDNKKKDGKNGKDEPNWLTDPRFKHEPPVPGAPPADGGATGKQPWAAAPPQGGWQAPVPGVQPAPPGGMLPGPGPAPVVPGVPAPPGMGVLQPQPNPGPAPGSPALGGGKKVEMADMREVWIYIENRSGASGKMPPPAEIYAALIQAKSPAAELVRSGAIILTGATSRESVWAFEANAAINGGLVASQNGVETLTVAELKQRLGK